MWSAGTAAERNRSNRMEPTFPAPMITQRLSPKMSTVTALATHDYSPRGAQQPPVGGRRLPTMTATLPNVCRVSWLPHFGQSGCQPDSFLAIEAKASKRVPHLLHA
jgi:hypothetical protein